MLITPAVVLLSDTRRNGTGVNLGVIYRGVIAKGVNAPGHIYQGVIVPGLMSYIPPNIAQFVFKDKWKSQLFIGCKLRSIERTVLLETL